jgi:hypothetical protein
MSTYLSAIRAASFPLSAVVLALVAASPAAAASAEGRFAVRGVGTDRCDVFQAALAAKDAVKIDRYASWLMGYVSASNRLIGKTFDVLPTLAGSDVLGMVAIVCRSQPATAIETAAAQSLNAISSVRLLRDTPIVPAASDGKSVQIRSEAIATLQTNLTALKLFAGPADGVFSPQLIKAIKALQGVERLPVTGLPDVDTIIRAGLKKAAK